MNLRELFLNLITNFMYIYLFSIAIGIERQYYNTIRKGFNQPKVTLVLFTLSQLVTFLHNHKYQHHFLTWPI